MYVVQKEILAIEGFRDIILEISYQKCDTFHSDSQAAVRVLKYYVIDSKLIQEYLSNLNETGKKNKVS